MDRSQIGQSAGYALRRGIPIDSRRSRGAGAPYRDIRLESDRVGGPGLAHHARAAMRAIKAWVRHPPVAAPPTPAAAFDAVVPAAKAPLGGVIPAPRASSDQVTPVV